MPTEPSADCKAIAKPVRNFTIVNLTHHEFIIFRNQKNLLAIVSMTNPPSPVLPNLLHGSNFFLAEEHIESESDNGTRAWEHG